MSTGGASGSTPTMPENIFRGMSILSKKAILSTTSTATISPGVGLSSIIPKPSRNNLALPSSNPTGLGSGLAVSLSRPMPRAKTTMP